MCGIIGYIGSQSCTPLLLDGLSKLEYRGYDSAGVAVVGGGELVRRRAEGKLMNLMSAVAREPVEGTIGIGHTRWATHGGPTENNAHPHRVGSVAVVHNGIIENHLALKRELLEAGAVFESETDTEVIAHLIAGERTADIPLTEAVRRACLRLEGAYSVVAIDATEPDVLVGARVASPLVVGLGAAGSGENFLASDIPAILNHTRSVVFLEEGRLCEVRAEGIRVLDITSGDETSYEARSINWSPAMAEKGGFKHFMLKEIHEQPSALADTLRGRVAIERAEVLLEGVTIDAEALSNVKDFYIVACGTSWHAGMVGQYLFEDLAGISPRVELGSEFRYRNAPLDERSLVLAISQSGETADTLAAIKDAKAKGATVLSICNVLESSIPRACHGTLYTHAGPEIGVASTKAFTTQIAALHLMALQFGRLLGKVDEAVMAEELDALIKVASTIDHMLEDQDIYREVAKAWAHVNSMLFLGRGNLYPLALEGALKLKEISYIHAEGYAAGEMKHGPIALIEETVPTVCLNPKDRHYEKVASNRTEVKARSGPVLTIATEGDWEAESASDFCVFIPDVPEHVLPLVAAVPMQLLAYHFADHKGTDVDQPRNLAKSVTVE